jgi:hypothetical protein
MEQRDSKVHLHQDREPSKAAPLENEQMKWREDEVPQWRR